jgi:hypothetical protein
MDSLLLPLYNGFLTAVSQYDDCVITYSLLLNNRTELAGIETRPALDAHILVYLMGFFFTPADGFGGADAGTNPATGAFIGVNTELD